MNSANLRTANVQFARTVRANWWLGLPAADLRLEAPATLVAALPRQVNWASMLIDFPFDELSSSLHTAETSAMSQLDSGVEPNALASGCPRKHPRLAPSAQDLS